MTFTNLFLPTDSLFLAILLVKQYIKLEWPNVMPFSLAASLRTLLPSSVMASFLSRLWVEGEADRHDTLTHLASLVSRQHYCSLVGQLTATTED